MMRSALITGLAGTELSADERQFLADMRPAGIILFSRNCETALQIERLVGDAIAAIGTDDVLVAIDQEGGRVQRLRPPLGRALPPARLFGEAFARCPKAALEAAFKVFRLLADDLRSLGINTDCVPVLDLPVPGSDGIIGDRAYGDETESVVALGGAVADGLMAGGVVPVMKHIPGHGRATCDSHLALPVVDAARDVLIATDFEPFRQLARLPAAMTAHVVYTAIDAAAPATTSRTAISEVVRGHIGFEGLLMSDDLSMKALQGSMAGRAEASIAAGCDVALHCNGDMTEMREVVSGVPQLAGDALRRFEVAVGVTRALEPFDRNEAEAALAGIMASCGPG